MKTEEKKKPAKPHDPRAVNPRYGTARLSDLVRAVALPKKLREKKT